MKHTMSLQTEAPVINGVHQRRVLKTAVPGPRSRELHALRQNAISNGLAIELVKPGGTEPAPEMARLVSAYCHREGVLTLVCGTHGNVIRLLPPLVISDALLHEALDVLEQGVAAAAAQPRPEA